MGIGGMWRARAWATACAGIAMGACAHGASVPAASPTPGGAYRVWAASESVDQIALIEFNGREAAVVRRRNVGSMPVEIDGPHGVAASPDGQHIYVTLGHGLPSGWLLKLDGVSGEILGRTPLGLFPATASVTPDGQYAFVSNFNLHGDHVPSSISKVHLGRMVEVARTETCIMPHGSRVNPQGTRHYSVCMMDERLIEIDVPTGQIRRAFSLQEGMEGPLDPAVAPGMSHAAVSQACSPTWAEPGADGSRVYVTCNRAGEVLEIDVDNWRVIRRFETGDNPYNLAVTPDGRYLLVTLRNRTDPALEIHDLDSGARLARIMTSTTLPHGIAVSEDSRYAFISVEGVGSEPGKVDIVDVAGRDLVSSVQVGQQATGIAVLPGRFQSLR